MQSTESICTHYLPKMSASLELNGIVIAKSLHTDRVHARHKTSCIIRDTGYGPSTVYHIVSNFRHGNGIQRNAHNFRSDKICSKGPLKT